jgi:hypothetical protein
MKFWKNGITVQNNTWWTFLKIWDQLRTTSFHGWRQTHTKPSHTLCMGTTIHLPKWSIHQHSNVDFAFGLGNWKSYLKYWECILWGWVRWVVILLGIQRKLCTTDKILHVGCLNGFVSWMGFVLKGRSAFEETLKEFVLQKVENKCFVLKS